MIDYIRLGDAIDYRREGIQMKRIALAVLAGLVVSGANCAAQPNESTVKLDIKPTIVPKAGGFLVTLAFQNSGKEAIAFSSPSVWEGRYNPMAGSSWAVVPAVREDNIKLHNESLEFDTGFIGSPALVNKGDFQSQLSYLITRTTRLPAMLQY